MRELVFALEFRGQGRAVPGVPGRRHAHSTAPSQTLETILGGAGGIEGRSTPRPGEAATLDSEIERGPDGTFTEWGTIRYGTFGRVEFVTVGRGVVTPGPAAGAVHGAVTWTVTRGEGGLAGAQGLITSNFAVSADGEVVDHHVTRLYLPD